MAFHRKEYDVEVAHGRHHKRESSKPIWSAKKPCTTGTIAPPTIAVQITPDAMPVNLPKPLVASEKMVGNIIELKKPMAISAHIDTAPPLAKIAMVISATAIKALKAKSLLRRDFVHHGRAQKRPTMAPPQ